MEDINLATVPTAALVTELKRRFTEIQEAQKELGFGANEPTPTTNRGRAATTGKSLMSKAADKRWGGWPEYKAQHPNATPKEFFKAKKAGKA